MFILEINKAPENVVDLDICDASYMPTQIQEE